MRESVICFFYGFWGDFAHIGKSFGNPLRNVSKHKNPNSQRSRPQIKILSLHPPPEDLLNFPDLRGFGSNPHGYFCVSGKNFGVLDTPKHGLKLVFSKDSFVNSILLTF